MKSHVVVVGGANLDIKGRLMHDAERGTSNPGVVWRCSGGVGRNIAENLAVIGSQVRLVAPVGEDDAGDFLITALERAGVDTRFMIRRSGYRTGTYVAVINRRGELDIAVSDMEIVDELSPEQVEAQEQAFEGAAVVCLDANLSQPALSRGIDLAERAGAVIVVDPVSVAKSRRLLSDLKRIAVVTPSRDELSAMAGMPVSTHAQVAAAVADLNSRGVRTVVATLGEEGVCYQTDNGEPVFVRADLAHVVDVTGAGDAFTAGIADAIRREVPIAEAVEFAKGLAAQIVSSEASVLKGGAS